VTGTYVRAATDQDEGNILTEVKQQEKTLEWKHLVPTNNSEDVAIQSF
jgi:hypothetical protein